MIAKQKIIIATRQSRLALWQAEWVKQHLLAKHPHLNILLLAKSTTGDRTPNISLATLGGKNLFTKELQQSVLSGEADIAVHSVKDLAAEDHPGLCLASILKREDARDVFIANQFKQFSELPLNAVVGTASPRRQCQILAARPDLQIKLLRGNVETRVAKLRQGEYDAIILAAAGLKRLDMAAEITDYFAPDKIIPAIGQGAIGIECRADDAVIKSLVQTINDHSTQLCVQAERAVNVFLGGDCFTPIAAHATQKDRQLFVTALVGTLDGSRIFVSKISGPDDKAYELGIQAGRDLENQGARAFLS